MGDDFDVGGACEAMLGQFRATDRLVATLTEQQTLLPTRLGSWRVIELVAHLTASLELVLGAAHSPTSTAAESSPLRWYRNVDDFADVIDVETRSAARAGWTHVRDAMAQHLVQVTMLLDCENPSRMVLAGNDTMTLEALCTTRCVEAVLHTLDLGSALSARVPRDRSAVAIVRRFVQVADNGHSLIRPEL